MAKVVSVLSVVIIVVLLLILGGTLVTVTGLQPEAEPVTASNPGTAFTYQGYLTQSQEPANGSFELLFSLHDDPETGNQVGSILSRTVTITAGLFTVELDFGGVFDGTPLWLEMGVRPAGQTEPFTPLLPRQHLTPVPFSVFATSAGSTPWTGLVDVPGGFADNVDNDRLDGLSCAPGQIPEWNGTSWTCGDDNVGTGNGAGDITAVHAGYGLGGGSDSGDATLYVLTDTIQTRVGEVCPPGASIQAINHDGTVTCEPDDDTTYSAGNQLALTGTTLDLVEGTGSGLDADLLDGQDGGYYRAWGNLTGVPPGLDDGDDDTTYSAGNQIALTGTTFDLVEGTGSGLDADLLDGQDGGYYRAWGSLTGVPPGLDDGDDDTTYSAGNQITLTGTAFDLVEGAGSDLDADLLDGQDGGFYRSWGNLTGVPPGLDDGDDDTTYLAGNQITLTGTTFDLVEGAGSGLDADLLDGQDGDYYLTWGNLITVPFGLDDGDDDTLSDLTCSDGQLPKWDEAGGQWTCASDLDSTYQPGAGLTLSETTFAISLTYQLPQTCGASQTVKWTGSAWACATDELGEGGSAWLLTGNAGTSPITNFLGTTDNQPLEFRVDGSRALRLEPNATSPNILSGYAGNSIDPGATGATVGGGGRDLAINQASGDYSTVDGGAGNTASGYASTVGGGEANSASDNYSTAAGGSGNSAIGPYATVSGGQTNAVTGTHATIAGGGSNQAIAPYASVGGGAGNVVSGTYATVSGGSQNEATGAHASVGGGSYNSVAAAYGTIAGGGPDELGNPTTTNNRVYDEYGTVGGGGGNVAGRYDDFTTNQSHATVGGGQLNTASASHATVGGGLGNAASGSAATIGGGANNVVTATHGTIGGGSANVVTATYGTIAGGRQNKATGSHATVGGGYGNAVTATLGTIPGGLQNHVGGSFGFAAGRQARAEHAGAFVWSDSSSTPFASTGPDQFLISAAGGVGIGTDSPSHLLTVEGNAAIQSSDVISVATITADANMLQAPRALYAVGDLLYAAGYATNTLSVWNITDPANHTLIGYTTFQIGGPMDLQVVGNRAYLASQNRNMLTILDVSNPADISHVGDTTEFLDYPQGVHVSGKYAYVASMGNDGLTIFDVSDAPAEMAATSFITTYLQAASDVFVVDHYAYVTSRANNRLVVFDVSDPRHPTAVGYTDAALSEPVRVHVSDIYAYVVAEGANAVVVYDISNPAHIVYLGQITTGLTRPRSIYVSGDRAYVAYAGDAVTSQNCGLAVLDLSDPADIAVLNVVDMSDWLRPVRQDGEWILVPPKPVAVTGSGDRIYVGNEGHDSVTIFEIDSLAAASVRAGELQVAHLEVHGYAAVEGDLGIGGGLNVGSGGALIQGALTVEGTGDSYIQGSLGIGPVATVITRSVSPSESEELVVRHPTHQLDVDGEARFRVNDHNHLLLRSRNTGSDEDAYIDFVDFAYPDLITPSARIEFDAADPITHSTSIRFYTQGPGDSSMSERLRIDAEGHLLPALSGAYSLGSDDLRWADIWTVGGLYQLSDGRYKENIRALPYGLEEIQALQPVAFAWRGDPGQEIHYGFIAQEVRQLLPEIVTGDEGENATLSMDYGELVPVLVKAVQEQQDEIETQAEQIADLEARLSALEAAQAVPPGQAGWDGLVTPLSTFGFGGLVLGAVALVGIRRKGGRP